jgi:hypothetical protein
MKKAVLVIFLCLSFIYIVKSQELKTNQPDKATKVSKFIDFINSGDETKIAEVEAKINEK